MAMILNPPGATESTFGHTYPARLAIDMGCTVSVNIFIAGTPATPALAALNVANNPDVEAIKRMGWSPTDAAAIAAAIASRNYL
jgi:hypothetical protein